MRPITKPANDAAYDKKPRRNVGVIILSTMSIGTVQPMVSKTAPMKMSLRGSFNMVLDVQPAGDQMSGALLVIRRCLNIAQAFDG